MYELVCIKTMKNSTDIIITDSKASLEKVIQNYIDCSPKEHLTIRSYFKTKTLKRREILHDCNVAMTSAHTNLRLAPTRSR